MLCEDERKKRIYRVTWIGSIVNFLLLIFKFIAGILGNSAAMIADAVHSLSDFITDVIVLMFVKISSKPQDKDHDYGHGKYETLATAIIGIILFAVGAGICWNSLIAIKFVWDGGVLETPGWLPLIAALISIVFKEIIYQYTIYVGKQVNSSSVIANAWHHRSDALSSIGTTIGIGGAILLGEKWTVLDPMAAVIVSLFIMKVSVKLLKPCVEELTETSLPEDIEKEIEELTLQTAGVGGLHNLRTRRIGNHYAIEMHIRMDGNMSLFEAHDKASEIEARLKERYGRNTHIGLHVEPNK